MEIHGRRHASRNTSPLERHPRRAPFQATSPRASRPPARSGETRRTARCSGSCSRVSAARSPRRAARSIARFSPSAARRSRRRRRRDGRAAGGRTRAPAPDRRRRGAGRRGRRDRRPLPDGDAGVLAGPGTHGERARRDARHERWCGSQVRPTERSHERRSGCAAFDQNRLSLYGQLHELEAALQPSGSVLALTSAFGEALLDLRAPHVYSTNAPTALLDRGLRCPLWKEFLLASHRVV